MVKMLEFSAEQSVCRYLTIQYNNTEAFHVFLLVICNDTDIRLVGGSNQYEGRVEICFNETWGTICDGSWSTNDANVACRQLGYGATGK